MGWETRSKLHVSSPRSHQKETKLCLLLQALPPTASPPAEPRAGVFLFSLGGKSPGCCAGPAVPVLEPQVHRKSAHLSADPHSSSPAMLSRCENNDLNSQGWKIMI